MTIWAVVLAVAVTLVLSYVITRAKEAIMATIADLDAALASQTGDLTTLATTVQANDATITDLLNKIAAGQPVDVSAELATVQANNAAIAAALTAIGASDARDVQSSSQPAAKPAGT